MSQFISFYVTRNLITEYKTIINLRTAGLQFIILLSTLI